MMAGTQAGAMTGPASSGREWVHATGSPRRDTDVADWPLPVGRVEVHGGLTFVYSTQAGGFSVDDYGEIPGGGCIELLGGVVVVHPEPGARHRWLVWHFYELLASSCPARYEPFLGPVGVPVGTATVLAPDVVVLPESGGPPAIVVEVREDRGACYRGLEERVKSRGYSEAGVGAYWVVEPSIPTVTVHELGFRERGRTELAGGAPPGE